MNADMEFITLGERLSGIESSVIDPTDQRAARQERKCPVCRQERLASANIPRCW